MLGQTDVSESSHYFHGGLVTGTYDENYIARTLNVFENIIHRLIGTPNRRSEAQKSFLELFLKAYPQINTNQIDITHIGNALASYISIAFKLNKSRWDLYLEGELTAISEMEKSGAMLFLGKGRCYVCHSGTYFTDVEFHSLAIPQGRVGKNGRYLDYGRAIATSKASDKYLFRTPPLRNVSKTAPYGHNGSFKNLESIIRHHVNPVPALYMAQESDSNESAYVTGLLGARSKILSTIGPISESDIQSMAAFLRILDSDFILPDHKAVPIDLPSGKNPFVE